MAESLDGSDLPPGWGRKYDNRTGRYYFINYLNKTTTWDDPRLRYRHVPVTPQHMQITSLHESIPLQHGSPDSRGYHVYPSTSSVPPPQPAFQSPGSHGHTILHFQDLTNMRPSPVPGRAAITPFSSPARTAESTMTASSDLEASVAKISAMFPTVTDTHIKTLLIKYHNREAVVMSALQVEKHPISTPGPYATPPLQSRHLESPRPRLPHSSPKMKLRYLKSIFPKAEETLLLDILSSSDNNVQKATEKLLLMGFEKRDTPPPRLTLRRKEEEQKAAEQRASTPTPPPRMKSVEEKQKMKIRLLQQYPDIPDKVISIALESVDYDEDRANQILNIMIQEERKVQEHKPEVPQQVIPRSTPPLDPPSVSPTLARKTPEKPISRRHKNKKDTPKVSRGTSTTEDKEYKSQFISKFTGPNRNLPKGPNDDLLLVDYVTWNGPNSELLGSVNKKYIAKGPDRSLLGETSYVAKGANPELRKGPLRNLAKGSIYSRLSEGGNESRGK